MLLNNEERNSFRFKNQNSEAALCSKDNVCNKPLGFEGLDGPPEAIKHLFDKEPEVSLYV